MSHPLLPLPERSKKKDEVYSVLGRALAYATEFENNCRVLACFFDIKESNTDFGYEVSCLMKNGTLFQKIDHLVDLHQLPAWTAKEIHRARKARNRIAHDIALQHIELESDEESIMRFQSDILLTIQEIITGNQIVLDVTRLLREAKREGGSDYVAYHSAVCEWLIC